MRPDARPEPLPDLLLAGLIHELRHPLTAIHAGLRLARAAPADDRARGEGLALLAEQVVRLSEVLATYQDLMEPAAPPAPFDVDPVVARTVGLFAGRLRPLGARFALVPAPGARALGAPGALLHAIGNLLSNALEAVAAAGSPSGRVTVRVLPPGSVGAPVEVRVADEGGGIPEPLRTRIFEAGFSTRGSGRGVGLAVARRMLELHGGAILLVPAGDPRRLPWAHTELAATLPAAEGP